MLGKIRLGSFNFKGFMNRRMFSSIAKAKNITVVGAGQIGTACSKSLLESGFNVSVYDPSTKNKEFLESRGAKWLDKVEPIVDQLKNNQVDILVTALPAPPQVRFIMEENKVLDNLSQNVLWIDHTTTDPEEASRLHNIVRNRGIKSLEAPLTGGYELLKAKMMTTLVGGERSVLKETEEFLRLYLATVLYMGDFGAASIVKIITNQLAAVHLVAAGEAAMMAKKSNINMREFFDGVRASAGNSFVFETEVPLMFNDTYDPGFFIKLHNKDLGIGRKIHSSREGCADYDNVYKVNALTEKIYKECEEKYHGEVGSSYPAKMLSDSLSTSLHTEGFDDWTYTIEKVTGGSFGVVHKKKDKI